MQSSSFEVFRTRSEEIKSAISVIDGLQYSNHKEETFSKSNRVIRNGLCIMMFAALEDFICSRCNEIALKIDPNRIQYDTLPQKMRKQSTLEATRRLCNAAKRLETEQDRLSLLRVETETVSSASTSNYRISKYTFMPDTANVTSSDVGRCLSCFGVSNPWKACNTIIKRLGMGGVLNAESEFNHFAKNRHSSAHDASHEVPSADLDSFVKNASGIAISFDILATIACDSLATTLSVYKLPINNDFAAAVPLRFIEPGVNSKWKESTDKSDRVYRWHDTRDDAVKNALKRCISNPSVLVERSESSLPINRHFPFP